MLDESIHASKKALDLEPKFALAHNNLAVAYYYKEDFEGAIQHFDKAREFGFEVEPSLLKALEPYRKQ